ARTASASRCPGTHCGCWSARAWWRRAPAPATSSGRCPPCTGSPAPAGPRGRASTRCAPARPRSPRCRRTTGWPGGWRCATARRCSAPADADPGTGVLDRLTAAGISIDRVVEEVGVRPLREPEAAALGLAPGLPVLVVERTHFSGRRPVETSDLVGSTEHCRLVYRLSLARPQRKRP